MQRQGYFHDLLAPGRNAQADRGGFQAISGQRLHEGARPEEEYYAASARHLHFTFARLKAFASSFGRRMHISMSSPKMPLKMPLHYLRAKARLRLCHLSAPILSFFHFISFSPRLMTSPP